MKKYRLLLVFLAGLTLGLIIREAPLYLLHQQIQATHDYWVYAPDEQRNWSLNDWRVFTPAPVRFLIPYHGDLLVVTGIYGGVYSLEKHEWLLKYDKWFDTFDYKYIAGNGLDVLLIAGYDSPYILKYDGRSFKWVKTPSPPVAITRPYGFAEETTKEDCYFLAGNGYIYYYNPRDDRIEERKAKLPVPWERWSGFGAVGLGGKAYFADSHPVDQGGGIYQYDPAADTLTRVYSGRIVALQEGHAGNYIALEEALNGKQSRIVWTRDFSTFKVFILPESDHFRRGVYEFGSSPNIIRGDERDFVFSRNILYAIGYVPYYPIPWAQPSISPLFGSPIFIQDMAPYRNAIAVAFAGTYKGDRYYSTVSLMPPYSLMDMKLPPATAVIWDSTKVSAGEVSLPVITAGWRKFIIFFTSDTPGDLVIQVDLDGSGMFEDYLIRANVTREFLTMDGHFAMMRLKFSSGATVTAKLSMAP